MKKSKLLLTCVGLTLVMALSACRTPRCPDCPTFSQHENIDKNSNVDYAIANKEITKAKKNNEARY